MKIRMYRTALAITLAALFLSGCRTVAPLHAEDDAAFERPVVQGPPGMRDDATTPEILLPGDMVTLSTLSADPMDAGELTVDAAGLLHVPLIGAVRVEGLTLEDAASLLEKKLHRYDLQALVRLRVTNPAGHTATVAGAVEHPGVYLVTPGNRVADLIARSGGFARQVSEGESVDLADVEAARVVRAGAVLPVSVARALEGNPLHNVHVRAGDLIVVPPMRGERVSVLGNVHFPKVVPFRTGLRLTDALAIGGGADSSADGGDIRIIRGPLSHPHIYRASLDAIVGGGGRDVMLEPGDVIFVTESWFASATDVLNRLTPLLLAANLVRVP